MKFLILASFALLCTATTVYKNRNITVDDNGTILITSPTGKRVAITKEVGLNGQGNIEIAISGPNIPTKRIQVDNNWQGENQWYGEEGRAKRGSRTRSQGDVLSGILGDYQGVVSDSQYQTLLNRIYSAVNNGEVNPQIYYLLQALDQPGVFGLYGTYPQVQSLYSLYQGQLYTPNVNPLYNRISSSNLLANQLYGGSYGFLGGYQALPQSSYYSRVLGGNPLLRQLVGQNQIVAGLQRPIQTIQQREQAIQQLEEVQQQLQQNIQSIEQLNQIQQQQGGVSGIEQAIEQQQIAQLSGVQQAVQQLEQQEVGQLVGAIQQLQQQQQVVGDIEQQQQGYGYSGVQQVIPQLSQQYRQLYGLGRIQGQYSVPQSLVQLAGQQQTRVPLRLQQLLGVQQYGQTGQYRPYGLYEPYGLYRGVNSYYNQRYGGYSAYQPNYVQGYNTVPQVQVY